jgi:hypothetical protein
MSIGWIGFSYMVGVDFVLVIWGETGEGNRAFEIGDSAHMVTHEPVVL